MYILILQGFKKETLADKKMFITCWKCTFEEGHLDATFLIYILIIYRVCFLFQFFLLSYTLSYTYPNCHPNWGSKWTYNLIKTVLWSLISRMKVTSMQLFLSYSRFSTKIPFFSVLKWWQTDRHCHPNRDSKWTHNLLKKRSYFYKNCTFKD